MAQPPPTPESKSTAATRRVLVVDDSEGIRAYLADLVESWGYEVDTAEDGQGALSLLEAGASPDLVLLDVMMPRVDGLEALRRMRAQEFTVPVIILSVVGKAATIVEAMQAGATDYMNKPFEEDELREAVERAMPDAPGRTGDAGTDDPIGSTVWHGQAMREIRDVIDQISDTDVTVLIQGESGTGKENVARAVHARSTRAKERFVKVNCAALPEGLLESELFGYEKGAFTGAGGRKPGKFEVADGGTIFLDEIGEMSPGLQAKLLQVLQESRFARLGGNEEVEVDVRVVCATHQPLTEMIADNRFREDLYFRLNVVNLQLPPLRERREEIPALVDTFTRRYARAYQKPAAAPSPTLVELFDRYPFPGNVRELENMIKRMIVLGGEETIQAELRRFESGERKRGGAFQALLEEIEETAGELPLREVGRRAALQVEREAISHVLDQTGWNRKQAAARLGVSYKTLLQKIRECELEAGG